MANPIYMPIEDNFETTLRQQLDEDVTALTVYLNAVPEATLPVGYYFVGTLNPKTSLEENVIIESINTTLNTVTVKAASRAMAQGNSLAGTLHQHPVGSKFIISNPYLLYRDLIDAIVSKASATDQQFSGYIVVPVYLNAAARDVAIPSPINGTEVYLTTEGYFTDYTAGSWVARTPSASPPNATTAVAGKVEMATDTEVTNGGTTGGTAASLVATPSQIAKSKQKDEHNYALDTGIVNAAVVALTPSLTAYTTGMRFSMKLAFTVTGAMTVNVDGLGAKTVKKKTDQDIATGDYKAGQILELRYDGTYMQCLTPVSTEFTPLQLYTGEAIDGSTTPQFLSYGSDGMKDAIKIYHSGGFFTTGSGTARSFGNTDATTRVDQSFVYTDAAATEISHGDLTIMLRKQGTPADNFFVEIQTDNAGKASGTVVTNGTSVVIAGGSLATAFAPAKVTFASAPVLVSGTVYHRVLKRSGANDAANYFQFLDTGSSTYAGGDTFFYTASTTTWGSGNSYDMQSQAILNVKYGKRVLKYDADNYMRANAFGFLSANYGSVSLADVYFDRYIAYAGLQDGATYVGSTTAGALMLDTALSAAPGTIDAPIIQSLAGKAFGDGKLMLSQGRRVAIYGTKISALTLVAGGFIDLFVPTGFRPEKIEIGYNYNLDSASDDSDGCSFKLNFIGKDKVNGLSFYDMYTSVALATGSVALSKVNYGDMSGTINSAYTNAVTIQEIYDNGFIMRMLLTAVADVLDVRLIEASSNN